MLGAGESYTFPLLESEGSCYLQATQPSAVYLYNNSSYDQNYAGGLGDPSMVWIAPVEQRINDVTFSTFDHGSILIRNSGYGALAWTVALVHRDTQVFAVEADNDKHLIASHTSYIPDNLHFVSEGEVLPECDFTMDNQDFMK